LETIRQYALEKLAEAGKPGRFATGIYSITSIWQRAWKINSVGLIKVPLQSG